MSTTYESVSEEQYLVSEPKAEYKSEYRDGRVVAMAGGSLAHSRITVNLSRRIGEQLDGTPCAAYSSDTRIKVASARFYTYPDLSVVCGKPEVDVRERSTVTNPTVIVEVLSPSTEAYDRGEKFKYYKKLDSLQDYVLVSQDRICVERFSRQKNGRWVGVQYESLENDVEIPSIECRIAVRHIYDKVDMGS